MRIGIDLDEVCYDFAASVHHYLATSTDLEVGEYEKPQCWDFYRKYGLATEQFLDTCNRGVDAGIIFSYGKPFPGVVDALHSMRNAGHTLHIITNRSFGADDNAQKATENWLVEHNVPYDTLTFSSNKSIIQTDFMIDDLLDNYEALDRTGCQVYLMDRPWNRDGSDKRRVLSMEEFAEIIDTYTKNTKLLRGII